MAKTKNEPVLNTTPEDKLEDNLDVVNQESETGQDSELGQDLANESQSNNPTKNVESEDKTAIFVEPAEVEEVLAKIEDNETAGFKWASEKNGFLYFGVQAASYKTHSVVEKNSEQYESVKTRLLRVPTCYHCENIPHGAL